MNTWNSCIQMYVTIRIWISYKTSCKEGYSIPGGQFVHPSAPLVEESENVPRGHGNIVATLELSPGIRLNPVATRA